MVKEETPKEQFTAALGCVANAMFCLAGDMEKAGKYQSEITEFLKDAGRNLKIVEAYLEGNSISSIKNVYVPRDALRTALPYAEAAGFSGTNKHNLETIRNILLDEGVILKKGERGGGEKTQTELDAEKTGKHVKNFRTSNNFSKGF